MTRDDTAMHVGFEVDPASGEVTAYNDEHRLMAIGPDEATARERFERIRAARQDPGYATENVTPITALDQSTIDALWGELRATLHQHDAYGWKGCSICRHLEAERVAARTDCE